MTRSPRRDMRILEVVRLNAPLGAKHNYRVYHVNAHGLYLGRIELHAPSPERPDEIFNVTRKAWYWNEYHGGGNCVDDWQSSTETDLQGAIMALVNYSLEFRDVPFETAIETANHTPRDARKIYARLQRVAADAGRIADIVYSDRLDRYFTVLDEPQPVLTANVPGRNNIALFCRRDKLRPCLYRIFVGKTHIGWIMGKREQNKTVYEPCMRKFNGKRWRLDDVDSLRQALLDVLWAVHTYPAEWGRPALEELVAAGYGSAYRGRLQWIRWLQVAKIAGTVHAMVENHEMDRPFPNEFNEAEIIKARKGRPVKQKKGKSKGTVGKTKSKAESWLPRWSASAN